MKKSKAAGVLADAIEAAAAPLPQGGAVSGRPDLLVLVRRILKARDPSALGELDAGIVEAAKGEPALATWLARPMPRPVEALDPLDAAIAALGAASAFVNSLPPNSPRAATILGSAANLAKTVENIGKGRPRELTADEVTERIAARRDEAVRKISEYTAERAAKLTADRKAFGEWAQQFGPLIGAELVRRLDEMLGGSTA